jgi:CDP-paratose 2-epimerase
MSCIYGPRQFGTEDQGWVAHFMLAAGAGRPLTIYGNGKQVRDLLYIDDLVRAFKLAARHIGKTAGNVYNIGGGPANSISIWRELSPRLESFAETPLEVHLDGWRPGDQPVYVSDTRKALRDFGWKPEVSVEEGLRRLWSWAMELTDGRKSLQRPPVRLPIPRADVAFAGPSA